MAGSRLLFTALLASASAFAQRCPGPQRPQISRDELFLSVRSCGCLAFVGLAGVLPAQALKSDSHVRFALVEDSIIDRIRSADAAFTNYEMLVHSFEFAGAPALLPTFKMSSSGRAFVCSESPIATPSISERATCRATSGIYNKPEWFTLGLAITWRSHGRRDTLDTKKGRVAQSHVPQPSPTSALQGSSGRT